MEGAANTHPRNGLPRPAIAIIVGVVLILAAVWLVPGLTAENDSKRASEERVCILAKTMADPSLDYDTAKILCRQP